jgi:hypothetical protein
VASPGATLKRRVGAIESRARPGFAVNRANPEQTGESLMLLVLINILIIVVVGAVLFWAIDKFVRDGRLANLLKILVVLICVAAILQKLLPILGVGF